MESVGGEDVPKAVRDAFDQSVETESTEVIRHGASGVTIQVPAEQPSHDRSQLTMTETAWPRRHLAQRLEQREHPRIAQAQTGNALSVNELRLLHVINQARLGHGVIGQALCVKELRIDTLTDLAEVRQGGQRFRWLHVGRIVERGFGTKCPAFLEVLLDVAALEVDVQTGLDTARDHPRPIPERRGRCRPRQPRRKQQADPVRTTQVEVVTNDAFEQTAAPARLIEDLRQADLDLPQAQPMPIPSGTIIGAQRPRKSLQPAVEEPLDVSRAERIAHVLQPLGVGAPAEAVVERSESDAGLVELSLGPLVAVDSDTHWERQVRTHFDEGRSPLSVLDVEIHVVDGDRATAEVERYTTRLTDHLARSKRVHLLLGDADDNDTFVGGEASSVACNHIILALATYEVDDWHTMLCCEVMHRPHKAVGQRSEERWRRDRRPEPLLAKGDQLTGRLQGRQVPTKIQAIEAGDGQADVVAEYGGQAGAGHARRSDIGDRHADRATPALTQPLEGLRPSGFARRA